MIKVFHFLQKSIWETSFALIVILSCAKETVKEAFQSCDDIKVFLINEGSKLRISK